jgi:peptide/nickel transport system substrate-binding protein
LNSISWLDQGVPRTTPVVNASPYFEADLETLYAQYDPALAAEHLDKAGLTMGANGVRQRPDGKPLEITIETERTGTDLDAIQLVSEMWTAVGVKTVVQTMTRDLFWPRATGNEVQVSVWSTDRGLEPFVDPIYMFPFDNRSWMGPLFGVYYNTGGQDGEAPTGKMLEAQQLYDTWKQTIDADEQIAIGKQIVRIATEEAWTISTVGMVPGPLIVKNNFRNVPEEYTQDWIYMSPGNLDPSQFFFKP